MLSTGDSLLGAAVDTVVDRCASSIGPNGAAFARRTYANGLSPYRRRLEAIGLGSGRRLLDAGCGFGQWSLSAASGYDEVCGVDVSGARAEVCRGIVETLGIRNCKFAQGSLERLPFPDASFDAAMSYSVLYFTDFAHAFAELARVLEPGGKLYFSTNDVGRFLMDIVQKRNSASDFNPRLYGVAALLRTAVERLARLRPFPGAVAMSQARTVSALKNVGFEILEIGPEGTLGQGDKPMQRGRFAGFAAVFDVLARRL